MQIDFASIWAFDNFLDTQGNYTDNVDNVVPEDFDETIKTAAKNIENTHPWNDKRS